MPTKASAPDMSPWHQLASQGLTVSDTLAVMCLSVSPVSCVMCLTCAAQQHTSLVKDNIIIQIINCHQLLASYLFLSPLL